MKIATTSFKADIFSDIVDAELILTPFFEEDVLADGERLYYYSPEMPEGVTSVTKTLPENDISNSEVSLRLSKYAADTDISLYAHRTYYREPHMRFFEDTAETYYPKLNAYGASLLRALLGGVAKLEGGRYISVDDGDGTDPMVKNSEQRYLAGFEKELFADFNIGMQYYAEVMEDFDEYEANLPEGAVKRDKIRRVASLRLTQFLLYQTLRLSVYAQYSPTDKDYYVNPEIKYNLSDNLYAAIGANIFGGEEEYTMYGQFDKNDNIYTQLRYSF